jgi:hypothetical protein
MAVISGAHTLLTNIVPAWTTGRMGGVMAKLKRDGARIGEEGVRRIGPAHFSHNNLRGTFRFNTGRHAGVLVERAAGKDTPESAG